MIADLSTKISDLTVGEFLELFNPDMRREVMGAAALAEELGVSKALINRRKAEGVFDGCYRQSVTGRSVWYNVELCKQKLTIKYNRK